MPLPKLPSKPAALLSPDDYPKAEARKPVKPHIQLIEAVPAPAGPVAKERPTEKTPAAKKPAFKPPVVDSRMKSSTSRAADRSGLTKLFVLDTNVLMHDPTACSASKSTTSICR